MIKTSFNERKWTDLISDPKSYGDFVETGPRALEGELKALNLKQNQTNTEQSTQYFEYVQELEKRKFEVELQVMRGL